MLKTHHSLPLESNVSVAKEKRTGLKFRESRVLAGGLPLFHCVTLGTLSTKRTSVIWSPKWGHCKPYREGRWERRKLWCESHSMEELTCELETKYYIVKVLVNGLLFCTTHKKQNLKSCNDCSWSLIHAHFPPFSLCLFFSPVSFHRSNGSFWGQR